MRGNGQRGRQPRRFHAVKKHMLARPMLSYVEIGIGLAADLGPHAGIIRHQGIFGQAGPVMADRLLKAARLSALT